jgi:hypothetical protein
MKVEEKSLLSYVVTRIQGQSKEPSYLSKILKYGEIRILKNDERSKLYSRRNKVQINLSNA